MKVDIQARDFKITDGIRTAVLDACQHLLRYQADRITEVCVHLADINGPRGGNDKLCRVAIHLKRGPVIVAHQVGDDLYLSIRQAVARASRGSAARLKKRKNYFAWKRNWKKSTDAYGAA